MNETINKATGETIKYSRIGGTPDNPIYFNDPVPTQTQPLNQTPTTPISATTMTQGVQPLVLPRTSQNPVYNELARDVGNRTQTQIDVATQEAEALQRAGGNQADTARKALSDEVKKLFAERGNLAGSQSTLEEQAGISEEQKNLREVNTEIANTTVQLRAEQDRIRNTPMSLGQKSVETGNLQDTFGRRLADLAIRQSASQGNITAIQQDVERKLKIALAPIDNKLEYFKTFEKDNVDALTAKEKDKLALIQSSLQDQKKKVEDFEKKRGEVILEIVNNGGGNDKSVINAVQGATDIAGLYSAGGKYIGRLDRQIKQQQLSNLQLEAKKKVQELGTTLGLKQLSSEENARLNSTPQAKGINDGARFASALQEYKDAINKYGTGELFGKGSGALGATYQAVVGAVKDYYTLGTLDNGVEKLVALGIPKPSLFGLKSGRISGIDSTIQNVINNVERDVNQLSNTGYANSVEGQEIIQTGRLIAEAKKLAEKTNEDLLNSLESVQNSGSTSALSNSDFFNR